LAQKFLFQEIDMSRSLRRLLCCCALIGGIITPLSAEAFFHLWKFTELFSNADGSVQFMEFHSPAAGENFATGSTIRSMSTGKVFTFDRDLTGSTANKNLLVATAGFGSLAGGVTPDYTLPANFFNPAGDTVRLCFTNCNGGNLFDTRTFTSVPTDGVMSRVYPSNTLATNSPRNFAGTTGSVNLAAPSPTGDYNGNGRVDAADYAVWRNTQNQPASPAGSGADGNASGTVDAGDYTFWRARFGNSVAGLGSASGAVAIPEPATSSLVLAALVALPFCVRRRAWNHLGS
jgi:hypothetical protein